VPLLPPAQPRPAQHQQPARRRHRDDRRQRFPAEAIDAGPLKLPIGCGDLVLQFGNRDRDPAV
jgi:hypothetical protein